MSRRANHELTAIFGAWGERLWLLAIGIDERRLRRPVSANSISEEHTFDTDGASGDAIELTLFAAF
jgi:nucleotidyltransferase/DNA polymerase involved in DNA repair